MFIHHIITWLAAIRPVSVQAHCDTADGPAVTDGRTALQTGNVNYALKWVAAEDEAEVREVFDRATKVRGLGPDAAYVADRLFLETMVRLHRMAEGVGFTGIQPTGTDVAPVVKAADEAIATGSDADLLPMVPPERRTELHQRFEAARALKDFDVDDLDAARRYVAAYVGFFKYAEGEEHEHGHHLPGGPGSTEHHGHAH